MPRYRGDVEQARKSLREMGYDQRRARELAPRAADQQRASQDREAPPFSWAVGCPAIPERGED